MMNSFCFSKSGTWRYAMPVVLLAACVISFAGYAEVPAIAAVMDEWMASLSAGRDLDAMASLDTAAILETLNEEQRRILGTAYWHFDVDVPVVVSVVRDTAQQEAPFWLEEQGFKRTDMTVRNENYTYEVWQKSFPAGHVGLGINGFDRHRPHYFVGVGAQSPGQTVTISNAVPAPQEVYVFKKGATVYLDWTDLVLEEVPAALEGHLLLPTIRGRAREAEFIGAFRETLYPASNRPDMALLTWSDDPKTTQTIQWRTATNATAPSRLQFRVKGASDAPWTPVDGASVELYDRNIVNDPRVLWHTVTLEGLRPGTVYEYAVGDGNPDEGDMLISEFRTAPEAPESFTFLWMSDTHNRPDSAAVLSAAWQKHPDTAFLTISGDLVGTGQEREDWDLMFRNFAPFLRERPLMPSIGNHDAIDGLGSGLYRALLRLPDNGPEGLHQGQTYSLRYGDLLLISLDVTEEIAVQRPWLEATLRDADAPWKVAVLHFPPYALEREYPEIEQEWGTLFDQYHVDVALSGHVHHYLRTFPLKAGKRVASPAEGTIYLISVSIDGPPEGGEAPEYAEIVRRDGFATCTAFTVSKDRFVMNVYKADGTIYDTFTLTK
jgi:hypothetical protein